MVKGKRIGYLLLGVVFVLGAVAGGGAVLALSQESQASVHEGKPLHRYRLRALTRKLDLDQDQESRVAAILASDDDTSRAISRDMVQRCGQPLRDQKKHVDDDIRTTLRPGQQRRFDKMVEERRRHAIVPARAPN